MRTWLRTALARMLGAGSPLVVGRLLSAALTFMLPLVLARLLTPQEFGTYKQFFLIAVTIQLTGQLGLTSSLYYFMPRGGAERGAYVAQAFLSLLVLGAGFGVALWFAAPLVGSWIGDGAIGSLRAPLALFAGCMLATVGLESAIVAEGKIGAAAATYVLSDGARAFALVIGAKLGGPSGLFWAAAASSIARLVAMFVIVLIRIVPFASPQARLFRRQVEYALPFAGAVYLYVAQKYFSQYAVSAQFDARTFALFAVATFHMPVVDIIYTPMSDVMIVQMGQAQQRGDAKSGWGAWNDAVLKLGTILIPASACAWLFGPTLLPLLFTHKYDASVPLFMLATLEIPLWVFPLDPLLRAAGDTRFLFAFNGGRVVLTGLLVIGGIRAFGLPGAIGGGLVAEAIARGTMLARGRRHLRVSWSGIVAWRALGRRGAAAAVACIPAAAVNAMIAPGILRVVVGAVTFAIAYFVLLVGTRSSLRVAPASSQDAAAPSLLAERP